jgi:hypothetical protein
VFVRIEAEGKNGRLTVSGILYSKASLASPHQSAKHTKISSGVCASDSDTRNGDDLHVLIELRLAHGMETRERRKREKMWKNIFQ